MPTAVAIQCVEVTTSKVPSNSGRFVKDSVLLLMRLVILEIRVELNHQLARAASASGADQAAQRTTRRPLGCALGRKQGRVRTRLPAVRGGAMFVQQAQLDFAGIAAVLNDGRARHDHLRQRPRHAH